MANYAVAPSRRYDTSPYDTMISQWGPAEEHPAQWFDVNPENAYNLWINSMMPSTQDDAILRRRYSNIISDWRTANEFGWFDIPDALPVMNYLTRVNPNQEIARYSRASQGFGQRQFTQPSRWVY